MPLASPHFRISNLDLIKGIVMVVMALDHTRDYFHADAFLFDPGDPIKSNLPIFLTRWITHFCAPAFAFLAGLSAYFTGLKRSSKELSFFLFTRGLWLITIELVIVNFGWFFDPNFHTIGLLTIWSLGWSMIFLSALVFLPANLILVISCLIIFGHNLLDGTQLQNHPIVSILHAPFFYKISETHQIFSGYPLIPWIAVMSLGFCFGRFYSPGFPAVQRKKWLNVIGMVAISLFFLLGLTNWYGDPSPFVWKPSLSQNIIDFFNPSKYPPSLQFLLMTLGAVFIFMANTESKKGSLVEFFSVFGRVPFFYYIIHIYLIHMLAMLTAPLSGFKWSDFVLTNWIGFLPELKGYGYSLLIVFLVWITIVLILFPVCKWYDGYKQQNKDKWWLSYL